MNTRLYIRSTLRSLAFCLLSVGVIEWCSLHGVAANPIVSVSETGGDGAPTAQFTGNTFTGPAIGTYTVPNFGVLAKCYADRTHAWTNASGTVLMPSYLTNNAYIMIRNDNRDNANYRLDVTVNSDVRVYLLIDNRLSDGNNSNPPTFDATHMSWVTNEGYAPVITGVNRAGNPAFADEVGLDESADGSINQRSSIYFRDFPAGTFQLKQSDNAGANNYGVVVVSIAPTTAPPTPTNLTVVNFDSAVSLSWSAAAGATGYYVKRSDTQGGAYTIITNLSSPGFTDSPLVNGSVYYYVVSATNSVGESSDSPEVVGRPNPVVTGITAVGGTNQIIVSWSALPNTDTYAVYRAIVAGGPYTNIASGMVGTTYTDATVLGGRTYFYRVEAAITGGGVSGQSAAVSAPTAPNVPTVGVESFGSIGLIVRWTNSDPVLLQFLVEKSTNGVDFSSLASVAANQRNYIDSGLDLNTTYFYRVQATNSAGYSSYSATASKTTPAVAGFHINFGAGTNNSAQVNVASPVPVGYLNDIGDVYADRGNGFFYGWTNAAGTNITRDGRYRTSAGSPDLRYATFNHTQKSPGGATWDFGLPNGYYRVRVVGGDSDNTDSTFQYNIEGVITPTYSATNVFRWIDFTTNVAVNDERLTIANGPLAANNKIAFVDIFAEPSIPPLISVPPLSQTVEENRPVTLSVTLSQGTPTLNYQWYFNNAPLQDATNRTLSFTHTPTSAQGDYYLIVTNYGGSTTSAVATLTVPEDVTAPSIVSVGSLDGMTIGVCFDEELDPSAAAEVGNYVINEGAVTVTNVIRRLDGRSVALQTDVPVTGSFTVQVFSLPDLAGNPADGVGTNALVVGLNTGDIGNPLRQGSHYTCDNEAIELVGGGTDIWNASDQFQFAFKSITGDFDARVRVTSLAGANAITKAAILARESTNADSRGFHVSVNPLPPGRDLAQMAWRPTNGVISSTVGTNVAPGGIPNAWLRLQRTGEIFTGYHGTNGSNWTVIGQTNLMLGSSLVLGLGLTAHDTNLLATGVFSNFRILGELALSGFSYSSSNFSASFESQFAVPYEIQYKNNLGDPLWLSLTNLTGNGSVLSFTNEAPGVPARFYRAIIP